MPVHAFYGQDLILVRVEKAQAGRRFVLVHHPDSGFMRLPLEWTDRSDQVIPPRINESDLSLDPLRLLRLAKACAASDKDIDSEHSMTKLERTNSGVNSQADGSGLGAVGHAFGPTEEKASGRMGERASQDDTQAGEER